MTYRNSPNRLSQSVPLHVAQRIEAERDALAEEVRRLRGAEHGADQLDAEVVRLRNENQRLAAQLEEASFEGHRLESLEAENQHLTEALSQAHITTPSPVGDENAIKQLSRRIQELEGDLSRSHRRAESEVEAARRDQRAKLLAGLGDVLDSTDLALRMNPGTGAWRDGLLAIRDQLLRFITSNGAKLTGEVGDTLDPHLHEAIAMVESPYSRGQIAEVHRHGIVLEDGTVARTALVAVST